jgi:hypothetical protein
MGEENHMHKKIIILIICMLLISPVFAAGQNILNFKKTPFPSNYSDDVPNWQNGDTWKYAIFYEGELGESMSYSFSFRNLEFTVSDSAESTYTVDINGDVAGSINLFDIQLISGTLEDTTIAGTATISKSNIGISAVDAHMEGKIAVVGIPIKTFTMDIDVTIDPPYCSVSFPISNGKQWDIPVSNVEGTVDISLLDNPINIDDIVGGDTAECTGTETIRVAAGSFNSYKIITDGDVEEIYYSPDAKNVIKAFGDVSNPIDIELKHTSHGSTPGSPNKPSKPNGPMSGTTGTTYTYSSSTTDNEGDQIYYLFSWGDLTDSGWIGPFPSGTICEASKKWNGQRTYSVKVKAKDIEGHESPWSDPLSVTMPKPKNLASLLMQRFFEKHPSILNLLKQIIS